MSRSSRSPASMTPFQTCDWVCAQSLGACYLLSKLNSTTVQQNYISKFRFHVECLSTIALFQNDVEESERDEGNNNEGHLNSPSKTQLQRCERHGSLNSKLPETFQTNNLLFYERFKAYQDYILGNQRNRLKYCHFHTQRCARTDACYFLNKV